MHIKYIFKSGRKIRLASASKYPKEFFYGYFHLIKKGYNVDLIEESDLGINKKKDFIFRIIDKFFAILIGIPIKPFFNLLKKKNLDSLNSSDILVVSTRTLGLTLGLLKNIGILKKPVLFFVMGLIPYKKNYFRNKLYKFILKDVNLVCISRNEKKYLEINFKYDKLSYIPFGVDNQFWQSNKNNELNEKYVLAIGNDYARDWQTLIDSWDLNFPNLKLVTNLPITTSKKNIKIVKGNWEEKVLSDLDIKKLYNNCFYVVIPLKDTIQPSGQSCCLQAMSCGKPVIMSDIKGLWDENLLVNGKNILLVKPNSVNALKSAIKEINHNKSLYNQLKSSSKKLIENHFNNKVMSKHIESKVKEIVLDKIK